jgi:hypothetical protein
MGIAVLLFILAIVAVHWWEYRRAITEYTFAQPATIDKHSDLRSVLAEKTPMAVEIGALPWRPEVVEKSTWSVVVAGGDDGSNQLEMSATQWLSEKANPTLLNGRGLAEEMQLVTGLADIDESRAWWWLPGMQDTTVGILKEGQVLGLEWIGAERKWIGCSHGAPLTLWLVHSRYRRYLPDGDNVDNIDPWNLTVADAPWIGRVQFVEVTVKPGWCIGLPAHWGFATRSTATAAEGPAESWWWTACQNSPLSWSLNNTGRILQHIGPSMSEEED